MIELIAIVAVFILLVAAVVYLRFGRGTAQTEKTERTVEDTVEPTERFERIHATLTYPDGDEEDIVYDDKQATDENNLTAFITLDSDCFEIGRGKAHDNYPNVKKSIPEANKRYINLDNIRDIDIDRTEELVAATEVEVTKKQKRLSSGNWRTNRYRYSRINEDYDFEVWLGYEWDARDS